jgi:hypothetical protein
MSKDLCCCRWLTNAVEPVRPGDTREIGVVCEEEGKTPLIWRGYGDEELP